MINKQTGWLAVLVFGGIVLVGSWWLNRGFGEVSPLTYEYSKALYSACLNQNEEHLNKIEQLLSDDAAEALPANERGWIDAIVAKARNGQWQSAAQKARRLMEDQVKS